MGGPASLQRSYAATGREWAPCPTKLADWIAKHVAREARLTRAPLFTLLYCGRGRRPRCGSDVDPAANQVKNGLFRLLVRRVLDLQLVPSSDRCIRMDSNWTDATKAEALAELDALRGELRRVRDEIAEATIPNSLVADMKRAQLDILEKRIRQHCAEHGLPMPLERLRLNPTR